MIVYLVKVCLQVYLQYEVFRLDPSLNWRRWFSSDCKFSHSLLRHVYLNSVGNCIIFKFSCCSLCGEFVVAWISNNQLATHLMCYAPSGLVGSACREERLDHK